MKVALIAGLVVTCLIGAISSASTKTCLENPPANRQEKENYDDECQYWRPGYFCHYQTKQCTRSKYHFNCHLL